MDGRFVFLVWLCFTKFSTLFYDLNVVLQVRSCWFSDSLKKEKVAAKLTSFGPDFGPARTEFQDRKVTDFWGPTSVLTSVLPGPNARTETQHIFGRFHLLQMFSQRLFHSFKALFYDKSCEIFSRRIKSLKLVFKELLYT